MLYPNPKLVGSKIVDCVPVPGQCPLHCPDCFFNREGAWYAPMDEAIMPTAEEAKGRIVRVNSGGDSNVRKRDVIALTQCYEDKFYNTSIADMDFPAQVVFTCNGRDIDDHFYKLDDVSNVMFVRVKVNSWNLTLVDEAVRYYTSREIPVVLTFMRYYTESLVKRKADYDWRKHILNSYWVLNDTIWREIWRRYRENALVFSCSSPRSSLCKDCHNCYNLYMAKKKGYSVRTLRLMKSIQSISFDPILADGKDVFLISPVRRATEEQNSLIRSYIAKLQNAGKSVHWPIVDTNQTASEWEICVQNGKAILAADEVHIIWDSESAGSKFDLGMVFMLNLVKGIAGMRVPVRIVNLAELQRGPEAKSFEGLLLNWKHEGDDWHD